MRRIISGVALVIACCGCSSSQAPASSVAEAEVSVEQGEVALKSGDFAKADKVFTIALSRGTLLPDLVEKAKVGRARARIGQGNFTGAKADLDSLAQGAAAMDQVWVVRGEMLLKEGDKAGAKNAYVEAKNLNPSIVIPPEAQ
jgi:Tfp pilus assembly protein PilF